jgi:hypothetical protein
MRGEDQRPRAAVALPAGGMGGVVRIASVSLLRQRQPFIAHLRLALAVVLSAAGFGYAVHSLWLGLSLAHALPYGDQWDFVRDYFDYLDGRYEWGSLFAQHNEHRIATTRVVLFADAILFRMRGLLPVVVTYASLAAIALACARLASRPGIERVSCAALAFGLLWSTSQWGVLAWQFQMVFPFVHLFALVTLVSLWRANEGNFALWMAIAVAADALAVFSLGSGILIIAPALLLLAWLRASRAVWSFALFHAALVGLYLAGYQRPVQSLQYSFDVITFLVTTAEFIGLPAAKYQLFAGLLGISLFAALVVHISYRAIVRAPIESTYCVLAALAGFALCEALLVGYVRAGFGVGARHATASVVFWAALLAALWKMTQQKRARLLVALLAVAAVVAANAPAFEAAWREQIAFLTRVTDEVRGDTFDPVSMHRLYKPDWTPQAVARLRVLQLGPFAPGR